MTSCRRALLLLAAAVAAHGCNRGPPFAEPPPAGVDAGIARGEELYLRGEFDSARAIWQSSLGAAEPRDSAAELGASMPAQLARPSRRAARPDG